MVAHSALESIVQRLTSFNESVDEEAVAVANALSIFENMVELSSTVPPPAKRCILTHSTSCAFFVICIKALYNLT